MRVLQIQLNFFLKRLKILYTLKKEVINFREMFRLIEWGDFEPLFFKRYPAIEFQKLTSPMHTGAQIAFYCCRILLFLRFEKDEWNSRKNTKSVKLSEEMKVNQPCFFFKAEKSKGGNKKENIYDTFFTLFFSFLLWSAIETFLQFSRLFFSSFC